MVVETMTPDELRELADAASKQAAATTARTERA